MRVHPIVAELVRAPIRDDVLPLTKPIVGASGRVYSELPVPKGTAVTLSTFGYNLYIVSPSHYHPGTTLISLLCDRNQDLWGPDAREFRPERWLGMNEQVDSPVGVYGNLYGDAWSFGRAVEYLSLIRPALRSPEALGAAWGGDSRTLTFLDIFRSPWDAEDCPFGSIIEMQAFLVTLIRKFDISPADHYPQIRRARPGMEVPLVLGEEHKGTQLPLKISAVRNA